MYARVSTINGKPEKIDKVIKHLEEATELDNSKGWKGAYVLVNHQTGKILTITLWESMADMEATVAEAYQIRNQATSIAGAAPATVEMYQVALQP
jgi:heme-degrading monooxygenase HmoA